MFFLSLASTDASKNIMQNLPDLVSKPNRASPENILRQKNLNQQSVSGIEQTKQTFNV